MDEKLNIASRLTKNQNSTQYLSSDVTEFFKQNWRLVQFLNVLEERQGVNFSNPVNRNVARSSTFISSKDVLFSREANLKNEVTYKNLYITNPLVHNLRLVTLDSVGSFSTFREPLKGTVNRDFREPVVLNPLKLRLNKRFPINANFVAQWISEAIVSSKTYKLSLLCDRVIKMAKLGLVKNTTNLNLVGLKLVISGRILGAEIATSKTFKTGQIPNNTITVLKDKGFALAKTRSGTIGVKVIYFWSV